jgi:hypothetical protein
MEWCVEKLVDTWWLDSTGEKREVAMKQLVMAEHHLTEDQIQDFLREIKLMRYAYEREYSSTSELLDTIMIGRHG